MATVYLCLGSNLGDRIKQFQSAQIEIGKNIGKILIKSSVYDTEPWGLSVDESFLNQVLIVESTLEPEMLLDECLEIEKKHGRVRDSLVYESRTLDIDLLFYDNEIINSNKLTLPHPQIANRKFVLEPLCEISPEFIHPLLKRSLSELLYSCQDEMKVKKL